MIYLELQGYHGFKTLFYFDLFLFISHQCVQYNIHTIVRDNAEKEPTGSR